MSIEEIKVGDKVITIDYDVEPQNPRTEWDNFGTITCNPNSRYYLGEEQKDAEEVDAIFNNKKEYIALPVYAYIHSNTCLNTTGFDCPWDSGQSGIIYVSRAKIRKEFSVKRISPKLFSKVIELLKGEVETFSDYLSGEVYGYEIKDSEGLITDSCYGFYGLEYCIEEARACA